MCLWVGCALWRSSMFGREAAITLAEVRPSRPSARWLFMMVMMLLLWGVVWCLVLSCFVSSCLFCFTSFASGVVLLFLEAKLATVSQMLHQHF